MNSQATMTETNREPRTIRLLMHALVFLAACLVLISRRPDAVLHPQFYGEGGIHFFADAYNFGPWAPLFVVVEGYMQVLPRLASALAVLVPLNWAPLVLNLVALAVQALPVNLLLDERSAGWGNLRFRAGMAGLYLALPNCFEVFTDITNAHWLLALSALLLLVAATPRSTAGKVFDIALLVMMGTSGPFSFFLAPVAIAIAWRARARSRWVMAGILIAACCLQLCAMLFLAPAPRHHRELGASLVLFLRILGSQIYLGTLLGNTALPALHGPISTVVFCVAALGCTALAVACFARSGRPMRMLLAFSGAVLLASFVSPIGFVGTEKTVWEQMATSAGIRYWFFPSLAFAWTLLWCYRRPSTTRRSLMLKQVSTALLALLCFGVIRDWVRPAFPDMHFAESVRRFDAAPNGATVSIPECPEGWNVLLVKRIGRR